MTDFSMSNKDIVAHNIAQIRNKYTQIYMNGRTIDLTLNTQMNLGSRTIKLGNEDFNLTRTYKANGNIIAHKEKKEHAGGELTENMMHAFGAMGGLELFMMLEHGREAADTLQTGRTVTFKNDINPLTGLPYSVLLKPVYNDFNLSSSRDRIEKLRKKYVGKTESEIKEKLKKGI